MTTRTPSAHAAPEPMSRAALLPILTAGLLLAGLAGAGPAAAVDDPTRPDARVTHGPSCRAGGVVVEVVAGSVPYAVTLATTRSPAGEDAAVIKAGESAVLSTGDVDWAETIDGYLEYTALDGTGARHVDDLDGYTFTRPAEEDCAAIVAPAARGTVPMTPPDLDSATPGSPVEGGVAVDAPGVGALPGDDGEGAGTEVVPPAGSRSFGDSSRSADAVAVAPARLARDDSLAPLFAAIMALAAATTGLITVAGRRVPRLRRPTRHA